MEIEHADQHDAEDILTLQRLAYQSEAALYNDPMLPPLRQTLEELRAEFTTHRFLKAVEDGQIVGSVRALVRDSTCHIGRLMVDPAQQQRGIGTALLQHVEHSFPTVQRFELFTGSRSQQNLRLYRKLGYATYETQPLNDHVTLVYLEKYRQSQADMDIQPIDEQ